MHQQKGSDQQSKHPGDFALAVALCTASLIGNLFEVWSPLKRCTLKSTNELCIQLVSSPCRNPGDSACGAAGAGADRGVPVAHRHQVLHRRHSDLHDSDQDHRQRNLR